MSVIINIAMSEETGSPQCASLIVRGTVEFDEEPSQPKDVEAFQSNVHSAIVACCRAVHDELRRHQQVPGAPLAQAAIAAARW